MAALALAAGLLLSDGTASAAGVANGSFENGPSSVGDSFYYRGTPVGWHIVTGYDFVDIIENGYSQPLPIPVLQVAQDGTHFLDMNGEGVSGGIYQDVTGLSSGTLMELSFYTAQWVTNSAGEAVSYSLIDTVNNLVLNSGLASDIDGSGWTLRTLQAYVPASGELRIQLIGTTGFQAGPGLDNVQLQTVRAAAAPEPTSWALMLLGFGGVGALLRRRQRWLAA